MTPVWKALSDPTRRRLLDLVKLRPRTTGELAARFRVTRFAVMKHLRVLERAGLIVVRRRGRERWNHLNAVPLQRIYERWISPYEAHWASSLLRLKRSAELEQGEEAMSAAAGKAAARVSEMPVAPQSIHIEQEVHIGAPPKRVFEALTKDIAAWWGAPYLLNQNARSIVLEPEIGGRLYEVWQEGDGALWAVVTAIERDHKLTLSGPMGMSGAVSGVIGYELEPDGKGTRLKLSHRAIGEVTEQTRANYTGGWNDLLATRLKAFVETGKRLGLAKG
ncbi:MAG TPA: metalloregulator ArsR/SmtB family transcription factor [Terriglobales bacterium]|nr:metalloregulator ArsR/SmtB family transcription factor [Terriglobales bacterium]